MKATFKVEDPKDIELTMTITMSLKEWNQLADTIKDEYPGWKFALFISQMVRHATMHLTEDTEVSS